MWPRTETDMEAKPALGCTANVEEEEEEEDILSYRFGLSCSYCG